MTLVSKSLAGFNPLSIESMLIYHPALGCIDVRILVRVHLESPDNLASELPGSSLMVH